MKQRAQINEIEESTAYTAHIIDHPPRSNIIVISIMTSMMILGSAERLLGL